MKRKKKTNFMSDGKVMIVHLIAALIKIMLNEIPLYKNCQCFPKPYQPFGGHISVKVDLFI